jgi:predicted acyl esterase
MKRRLPAGSAAFLLLLLALHAQQRVPVDPRSYGVEKDVMVPMRDGIKLAADLYFPARDGIRLEGKFPAVMERTPYNKDGSSGWATYYVTRG